MPSGSLNVSTAPYSRSAIGEWVHAELFEPGQPLVEVGTGVDFEPHVIEPGAPRIEGFALIPVVLLEFDDGSRRRVQQQESRATRRRRPGRVR